MPANTTTKTKSKINCRVGLTLPDLFLHDQAVPLVTSDLLAAVHPPPKAGWSCVITISGEPSVMITGTIMMLK